MKKRTGVQLAGGLAVASILSLAPANAADVVKAANATNLNLASSYVSGGPPGSGDVLVVNATMGTSRSLSLGADLSVAGIRYDSDATGGLTIGNAGGFTLTLGTSGISILPAATVNLQINSNIALSGSQTWSIGSRNMTVGGASVLTDNGNSLVITGSNNLTFSTTASQTIGAQITYGSGAVNFSGGGTYTLTNNLNQIASLSLSTGSTLRTSDIAVTGGQGTLGGGSVLINAATVQYAGNTATTTQAFVHDSRADYSRVEVTTSGQTLTTSANYTTTTTTSTNSNNAWELGGAGNLTVGGVISNSSTSGNPAVNLKKFGAGTLTLNGNNTYTGLTDVQAGTLVLNRSGGTIANAAAVQVSGGTLSVAQSDTVGAVTLSSGTISGAGTLTGSSYSLTNTGTVSSTLAGAGVTLTKTGAGTATLSGTNTYTGLTTVSAGTLLINGTVASAVSVGSGATLGGGGTVSGLTTTTDTTSVISAGNSPGTLSLSGGLNAAAGADFVFQLGTSSDLIALGSGVLTGSTAANGLVFEFSDSGGVLANTTYTLFTFGSSSGLDYTDLLANTLPSGLVLNSGFGTGGFQINGSSLEVQFSAVPEPSTYALLGTGLAALVVWRRRSRRLA